MIVILHNSTEAVVKKCFSDAFCYDWAAYFHRNYPPDINPRPLFAFAASFRRSTTCRPGNAKSPPSPSNERDFVKENSLKNDHPSGCRCSKVVLIFPLPNLQFPLKCCKHIKCPLSLQRYARLCLCIYPPRRFVCLSGGE